MKRIFVYGLITSLLVGCFVLVPKSLVDSSNLYQNNYQKLEKVTFLDTNSFDDELSGTMLAKTQAITVTTLASVSINEIPQRLNKWLSAVTAQHGHIYIEPKTTGVSSDWALDLLPKIYNKIHDLFADNISYTSASNYNATIFYNLKSGMIKKVVFSKK